MRRKDLINYCDLQNKKLTVYVIILLDSGENGLKWLYINRISSSSLVCNHARLRAVKKWDNNYSVIHVPTNVHLDNNKNNMRLH